MIRAFRSRWNGSASLACLMLVWACCGVIGGGVTRAAEPSFAAAEVEFFEQHVRPLLLRRCGQCHVDDQAGGLGLGSRDQVLRGGDSGPAIIVGQPETSRLIAAVRRQGEAPMPPDEPLSDQEVQVLEVWIRRGAAWTTPLGSNDTRPEPREHWAFQPIQSPQPPVVAGSPWPRNEVDAFILQRLVQADLAPSPPADRRTLIRRVTYALTGLPPTPQEIASFVADDDPRAYQRLIQRLLASPQYGQHQARAWLDLARYSDTKGYVYAREERFWVHAWNYRDWVVAALNDDMPYDRFLLLQIAADQVDDRGPRDLAAMGFLTLGRRFLGVKHDILDDRIDVVCRGTMALTVGCARCHHHKYDPIPTDDYYALYGIFDSCSEQLTPLPKAAAPPTAKADEVRTKLAALRSTLDTRRTEQAQRVRASLAEYFWAQTELQKYPPDGFDQIFAKTDLLPAFVRRFDAYLSAARQRRDPLFVAWHAYREIPADDFAARSAAVTATLQAAVSGEVNRDVLAAFREPPRSMRQVVDRYADLFAAVDAQPQAADQDRPRRDDDADQLWQFLYGEGSPCTVPDQGIVHVEAFFDTGTVNELWKLQSELDRAIIAAGPSAPFAVTLVDNVQPTTPRIFRRGNPLDRGAEVPRRFLTALSDEAAQPFTQGSGRRELAKQIIDPANPLTARVIVNRIWAQHFGTGLVATTSDFGRRADPPSHPQLLDYLASRFIAEGWSLKALHRLILLSATYRQNAWGPRDADQLARGQQMDPDNRLLWRMNAHRLSFEELRDSLLAAADGLDLRVGGKAEPLLQPPFSARRTIYGLVDRQFLPSSFRVFDFASPDLHIPQRNETTVPQQALFLMNDPLVVHQATRLADDIADSARDGDDAVIDALFQRVLRRMPTERERADARSILTAEDGGQADTRSTTALAWHYGYGAMDDDDRQLASFKPLPHRTADAWQGGATYPDPALGWVQLTAAGGHPGNDRSHASIRRWIAPGPMTIRIQSQLQHIPSAGDGVRAFIVSSARGVLASAKVHQQTVSLDVDAFAVHAGETIDMVVDIGQILNSDQYLWRVTIVSQATAAGEGLCWDSTADFVTSPAVRLSPLAQLAQVLMCSNEFMFVD